VIRIFLAAILMSLMSFSAMAQDSVRLPYDATQGTDGEAAENMREATGGASTLEDILRRQRGEEVSNDFRQNDEASSEALNEGSLGTLGGSSDPELWRALRFGTANVTSQVQNAGSTVLVQDSGMGWLTFREGPLRLYGGYFLLVVIAALALFFLLRGRIRIDAGRSGIRIQRFNWFERFSHWVLATSFILLAISGLFSMYARIFLEPGADREAWTEADMLARQDGMMTETLLLWSKWVHNNVSWAFMLALVSVFVLWVMHNLPSRTDVKWLLKGGGIFTKGHPPAKKFNAGQKMIFWAVIILGASVSASGLALLFPFELQLFAPTFAKMNAVGAGDWVGYGTLPETLLPHAEMQLSQTWHAIIGFVMIGVILAHIYIGTIGMEGAAEAMTKGDVDLNWAREHHSIWADKVVARGDANDLPPRAGATPAE